MHHDVDDRTVVTSRVSGIEQDPTYTVHRSSLLSTPLLWHILFRNFAFPGFLLLRNWQGRDWGVYYGIIQFAITLVLSVIQFPGLT